MFIALQRATTAREAIRVIADIQTVQQELEGRFLTEQAAVGEAALALHERSPRLAVD